MRERLRKLFIHANHLMFMRDFSEIKRDVSERSICANLKEMINCLLPHYGFYGYYADVEYNRAGELDIKQTLINGVPDNIVCDLIVHSRGEKHKDNLLCVEMKKSYATKASKKDDKNRLSALTSHYLNVAKDGKQYVADYELGIFYEINLNKRVIIIEYYEDGKLSNKLTMPFNYFLQNTYSHFCPFIINDNCKSKFCFHNVGQGLFYSGSLYDGEYNFIYDCGSMKRSQVINIVKDYCKNLSKNYVDFLAISHFHSDHISGIDELRKRVSIRRVFLPYLFENRDLTYLTIWGAVYINEENDEFDRNGLISYLYQLYYSDNAIVVRDEYLFNYNDWVFKFYNKGIDSDIEASLEKKLKNALMSYGYHSIEDAINYGDISILKSIYFSVFGKGNALNDTSLILLHYPINHCSKSFAYHRRGVCNPFSLLTGDIVFDSAIASKVASGYPDMVSGVGLIPHHGSFNNWTRFHTFFSRLDFYVASSGLSYAPKFPNPVIAKTLSPHSYIKVNEVDSFLYYIF